MLKEFKKLLLTNNLDGYVVPKNDEYFSEYAYPDRLLKISKFSGSAGFAILMKNKNFLFVDGRYTLQAQLESGANFKILEIPKLFPYDLFKNSSSETRIGFDPKLFTNRMLKVYFKNSCKLVPVNKNLVDETSPEKHNIQVNYFYNIKKENSGESLTSKTERLCKILKKNKIDNIFISAPENIAWLLNLRGNDNPNSPVPNAKGIITKNKEIYIFTKLSKIKKIATPASKKNNSEVTTLLTKDINPKPYAKEKERERFMSDKNRKRDLTALVDEMELIHFRSLID